VLPSPFPTTPPAAIGCVGAPPWAAEKAAGRGFWQAAAGNDRSQRKREARPRQPRDEAGPQHPRLIAQNEGIERAEAEQGLDELLAVGRVKKSPMGWKLAKR